MSTTWKYCAINDSFEKQVKKLKFFDSEGNHTVTEIQDVHKEIAKLGEDGWELVSLQQISQPNARVYYLKKSA
ncbi:MAG: hypothetical protein HeimC2_08420 [Candidatus Heimdallarchaeota archaeon LC_2]|nr:MAG: hypothetical protein HeimC2_08420 [Candidatus Heimdallarchaeota archaeon LC_2]